MTDYIDKTYLSYLAKDPYTTIQRHTSTERILIKKKKYGKDPHCESCGLVLSFACVTYLYMPVLTFSAAWRIERPFDLVFVGIELLTSEYEIE